MYVLHGSLSCSSDWAKKNVGTKGDDAMVTHILPAIAAARRPVKLWIYAINLSLSGFAALCKTIETCSNLTSVFFGYNPDMSLSDYENLKSAVLASPSPLTELRIIDDKKTPKVDWRLSPAAIMVRRLSDGNLPVAGGRNQGTRNQGQGMIAFVPVLTRHFTGRRRRPRGCASGRAGDGPDNQTRL